MKRPISIVCLCGSTKFKEDFLFLQKEYTLRNYIVLSVGFFGHADDEQLTMETKAELDILHLAKIDLAHEVCIISVDGYIGESTRREIAYANWLDKRIYNKNRLSSFHVGHYTVTDISNI